MFGPNWLIAYDGTGCATKGVRTEIPYGTFEPREKQMSIMNEAAVLIARRKEKNTGVTDQMKDLPSSDEMMQTTHQLLHACVPIVPMDIQDVDIVCLQLPE